MKKVLLIVAVVLSVGAVLIGYNYYQRIWAPNVVRSGKLYIPTGADYATVRDSLRQFLKNESSFAWLAGKKHYPGRVHSGRYSLSKGMSNNELANLLRSGNQDEISIRLGNYASIFELAGKVSPYLECDSQEIVAAIVTADFADGYDTAALLFYFRPETYNFHWDISGAAFVARMKAQFDQFWTAARRAKAEALGMSLMEVTTLASIVQLESAKADEQPKVAGLYLNRLRRGMKLDADPTVIFAMKKASRFQQNIQRVYYKDLFIASPYNTYRNRGLPPGPICMPNPSAIDAVLAPEQHDYLYFVADPENPGYHLYAKTLSEQERNAEKYRRWLDENEIK